MGKSKKKAAHQNLFYTETENSPNLVQDLSSRIREEYRVQRFQHQQVSPKGTETILMSYTRITVTQANTILAGHEYTENML